MPQDVRTVKRIRDGVIKRMNAGPASRLVARGGYEYIDNGPDESEKFKKEEKKATILSRFENKESVTVKTKDIKVAPNELAPEQVRKLRKPRKIKRSEIPKSRMDQIIALGNVSSQAAITPGKGSDNLKNLIEKAKAKRKSSAN